MYLGLLHIQLQCFENLKLKVYVFTKLHGAYSLTTQTLKFRTLLNRISSRKQKSSRNLDCSYCKVHKVHKV